MKVLVKNTTDDNKIFKLISEKNVSRKIELTSETEELAINKNLYDYLLYVISPDFKNLYAVAELIDDSNKLAAKTIFCIHTQGETEFTGHQLKSLRAVGRMVLKNKALYFETLTQAIDFLLNK